jgi:hypothetical protein
MVEGVAKALMIENTILPRNIFPPKTSSTINNPTLMKNTKKLHVDCDKKNCDLHLSSQEAKNQEWNMSPTT